MIAMLPPPYLWLMPRNRAQRRALARGRGCPRCGTRGLGQICERCEAIVAAQGGRR